MQPNQKGTWKCGIRHRNEKHNFRQETAKRSFRFSSQVATY